MKPSKKHIIKRIKEAVAQVDPKAQVILFGSQARNEATEESDWDLLILTDYDVDLQGELKFIDKLFEVELELGIIISTIAHSNNEWNGRHSVTPLFHNINEDGILL